MNRIPFTRARRRAILLSVTAVMAATPLAGARTTAPERTSTSPAASIATVTTRDFRVGVFAKKLGGGATPTADVRAAVAQRVAGGWRESGEIRLKGTYFWRTVTGPRPICKLEIATVGSKTPAYVAVRMLQSPSLGCGRTHRIPFPHK
jgi:hypothetical protein